MQKLNKKGFTLVELLVVLVILVIIMTIAIPSVTSSIERSKDKQKKAKIELIVSSAEIYADRYKNTFSGTVTIEELITKELLTKEEAKDPFNEGRTLCGYVEKSGISFTFIDTSTNPTTCICITDTANCKSIG